jgi:hypothetical protein
MKDMESSQKYYRCKDNSVFSIDRKDEVYAYIKYWNISGEVIHEGYVPGDPAKEVERYGLIVCDTLEEAFAAFPVAKTRKEVVQLIRELPPDSVLFVTNDVLKELAEIAIARMGVHRSVKVK